MDIVDDSGGLVWQKGCAREPERRTMDNSVKSLQTHISGAHCAIESQPARVDDSLLL
jgi:hypothetical protein